MRPSVIKDDFIRRALSEHRYVVRGDGQIISRVRRKPRMLKQSVMGDGYCRVGLSIDGEVHYVKVHRVVALALIPNPENKPNINHKDGIKLNNHPLNLEWITEKENSRHAVETGLHVALSGEASPSAKLTFEQVKHIRELRVSTKLSQREIGLMFGVAQGTVSLIERYKSWSKAA